MFKVLLAYFLTVILLSSCALSGNQDLSHLSSNFPSFNILLFKPQHISEKQAEKIFLQAQKKILNQVGVQVKLVGVKNFELSCPFKEIEFCSWYYRDNLAENIESAVDILYVLQDWKDQKKFKESSIKGFAEQVGAVRYKAPVIALSFSEGAIWSDSAVMAHEIGHLLGAEHSNHGIMQAYNHFKGSHGNFSNDSVAEIHALLKSKDSLATFQKSLRAGVIPMSDWNTNSTSMLARHK
jgi:hypothetical protein